MNPFLEHVNPANYDRARPYFHPSVLRRFAELLQQPRLASSLDVACGTGQSTAALAAVSDVVVGVDSSAVMLKHARRREATTYIQGTAEQLPFCAGTFDLVTVGLDLHWFNRDAFLREAHRVLRNNAWLS
jgi:ubiquinone/menaquinone biosynthesis C-methylase UbiE